MKLLKHSEAAKNCQDGMNFLLAVDFAKAHHWAVLPLYWAISPTAVIERI